LEKLNFDSAARTLSRIFSECTFNDQKVDSFWIPTSEDGTKKSDPVPELWQEEHVHVSR
jgi:hypothetical protein